MLQFFLELTIALLAVYGAYSALHEMVALLKKITGSKSSGEKDEIRSTLATHGKEEDSLGGEGKSGRSDHIGRDG